MWGKRLYAFYVRVLQAGKRHFLSVVLRCFRAISGYRDETAAKEGNDIAASRVPRGTGN